MLLDLPSPILRSVAACSNSSDDSSARELRSLDLVVEARFTASVAATSDGIRRLDYRSQSIGNPR
jgi:hypothetical protein